ncbi:hypothetical protein DSOUD_1046 [Desulfuromonas soudanensis]|uniref:Uncharacterized protein n=1 Tax=Desulfuromonas soudanensis TaxID=1603606 RepID=A0A0M4DGP1_9BACT|nr:hypothetical protein DSOUD_1046 [Desulfuromonas soudanensis]
MMSTLYAVSVPAINQHLKRIVADNELEEAAVIKQYLTLEFPNLFVLIILYPSDMVLDMKLNTIRKIKLNLTITPLAHCRLAVGNSGRVLLS